MKYKVGDMVRIRKDLHLGIHAVYERMTKYKGLKARIERVNRDGGFYLIDIDGGDFCWTDEMLEDVETDATDKTIRPDYYQYRGGDVFDMADYFQLSPPLTMALKYLLRAGKKDKAKEVEDLRKCIRCIEKHIELMEGKANDQT